MTISDKLLLEAKAWKREKMMIDKEYFHRLVELPTPSILWIETIDSMISVREVTNSEPGEILVYRNLANQVKQDDASFMAVLQDAVSIEKVDLIILCGYSQCTGIRDVALGTAEMPHVQDWLSDVKRIYDEHYHELAGLSFEKKERRLSELNIQQQILNLSQIDLVQRAWKQRSAPALLGWYFDVSSGELSEVFKMEPHDELEQIASLVDGNRN